MRTLVVLPAVSLLKRGWDALTQPLLDSVITFTGDNSLAPANSEDEEDPYVLTPSQSPLVFF